MSDATCSVEGCPKPRHKSTLCSMHAERKRLTGDVGPADPIRWRKADPRRPVCSVDDCDGTVRGEGYCPKHLARWKRSGDPLWPWANRSGVIIRANGYRAIWQPAHPFANADGYVAEHRKVVHDAGIDVPDGWHVHHVNGDKLDNRLENLEVVEASEHHRHHVRAQGYVVNQYGTWPLRNVS